MTNPHGDLAPKLGEAVQALDDAIEVMLGMFALDDMPTEGEETGPTDTALVALRESVTARFEQARNALVRVVKAVAPDAVPAHLLAPSRTLEGIKAETLIDTEPEQWLRRQLNTLSDPEVQA